MKIKDIIEEYLAAFERKYSHALLPGQSEALYSMLSCRTPDCGEMLVECPDCGRKMKIIACGIKDRTYLKEAAA